MLGRNWREALETGARSDRVLTIHYESLLPHIGDASKYLDLDSVEETMRAMAVIGMDARIHGKAQGAGVEPRNGLGHVVSLPAVTTERAAVSPSVR